MPQTAEAFLEERQQSAEDFLSEGPSAEAFLKTSDARVAQMASATRATVGVVGRAIAATDFAIKNIPDQPEEGSYEQQLSDNPLPTEAAIANEPDSIEGRRLIAKKQIEEGLHEFTMAQRRNALAGVGDITARGLNVFGHINWIGRILGGFTEDLIQGRVLPTPERGAIPNLSATGAAITGVPDERPPPQAALSPIQQGVIEGAKPLPSIIAAGLLVAGGMPPSAAFAITMGGTALEETQDPAQAAHAAAVGAVLPGVGQAAKQLGARVMAGAVTKGLVAAENKVAQKAVEAGAELLGIVAFNEAMHLPGYAAMTPEERKVALQKSLASNIAFLPMIVPTVFGKGRTATQERLAEVAPLTAEAVAKTEPMGGIANVAIGDTAVVGAPSRTPLTTEAVTKVAEKEPVPPPQTPKVTISLEQAIEELQKRFDVSRPQAESIMDSGPTAEHSKRAMRVMLQERPLLPWDEMASDVGVTANEAYWKTVDAGAALIHRLKQDSGIAREHLQIEGPGPETPVAKPEEPVPPQSTAPAAVDYFKKPAESAPTVPEHLRPSKATQSILSDQSATPEPVKSGLKTGVTPAPEGGAVFGIGGRRTPPVAPVGTTARGDKNFLRIPSSFKRIGRGLFTEGTRRVLGRTKNLVGQELAKATRKHIDLEQELFGMHEVILRAAVRVIPKERLDPAWTEASQYVREKENGRPLPTLSADAQSLVDAWFTLGKSTGDIGRANNVQVFDPALGTYRPWGYIPEYIPRMFNAPVEAVLRDPKSDPALFNQLADALATQKGIPLDAAATELRGVAGRFQSNDFMSNMELARTGQMPEIFYEYDLRNLAARYLPAFSERMAQIIAYGQRLGPRDAPIQRNLWDVAAKEAEDTYTQEKLKEMEDQGTDFKAKNEIEKNARRLQAITSASLLSDPTTTVPRNILTGLAATTEIYGVGRSMRAFKNAMKLSARLDAREQGVIRDDLASFINSDQLGNSVLDNAIRTTSNVALKISGFTPGENFVRTHNSLAASGFARDAAAALTANPASKLSREALAQFKRWDIDPEAIIAEQGRWHGPETRKYIRTAVREMQGGYRYDQVPLWAGSTAGRFFYQYGRWGVQRSQHIFQNIIKPAIGEDVTFRGKPMRRQNVLPLIRAAAITIGLGETFGAIAWGLFGKDRRDSSLSEISEAWSQDEKEAVLRLGERMANDIIMAGTLGIIGQPFDMFKAAKDQSRFKNPADPPSASGVKAVVELAQKAVDQDGTLTKKDWLEVAARIVRGPKNVSDVARHHLGDSLYMGQNDQRTLRMAAMRWAKETKQDVPLKSVTDIRKSPTAPAYEAVNEALLSGDSKAAKKAADEFIANQTNKDKARTALKSSVQSRHPFRAGNLTSEANRNEFMQWAKKNLSDADMEQIRRVQERYRKTANDAGLL